MPMILYVVGITFLVAIVLGIAAPLAMFALKAGLIRVPADLQGELWDEGRAWRWAAWWAAGITALGAFGALVFSNNWWADAKAAGQPSIERAYYSKYGPPAACAKPLPFSPPSWCHQREARARVSSTVACYPSMSGECESGASWNVIKTDALPFFVAATILLFARASAANARRQGDKSLWPFLIPALVGAVVFFVSMHFWDWLAIISSLGIPALIPHIIEAAVREVMAPIHFLQALASASPGEAVKTWLVDEVTRMGGSFYKLGSLYPKMLVVMILGGIVQYMVSSD